MSTADKWPNAARQRYNMQMRAVLFLLLALSAAVGLEQTTPRQTADVIEYVIEPGDTWTTLALRTGATPTELQALSGHINTARQPAIGSDLSLPSIDNAVIGAVWRTADGGLLQTAVRHNTSPWRLALGNGLSPYEPALWRPLLVPGETPLRDLPAGIIGLELAPDAPVPGQALAAHLSLDGHTDTVTVELDRSPLAVTIVGDNAVVVGGTGAFTEPGEPELSVQLDSRPVWRQPWAITDREWIFQQLTLTGEAAAIDQADIEAERERLSALWSVVSPEAQWTAPFRLPIADYLEISADYGARRSYNGGPYRSYHEGVDFSAYSGTPVTAPAAGTVVLAEPLFVRGGTVLIDHGLGIFTGYYHLSAVDVEPGQHVKPGDLLGEVGTTGLSTGNHLHWDLIANGTWVDAMSWLEQDTACWLLAALGNMCQVPG